ncbi:MAG: hypothetical protein GY710_04700 [Desulfobacteraceae bacterium]|nr:hypothetical protein [Desulfobacteraceae bacterium]
MGLLDGKKATTNLQFARLFKQTYPDVRLKPEQMMTKDDGIICTGAATAIYNLILHIIDKFDSKKLVSACAKTFLIDPARKSQVPYLVSLI